MIIYQQTITKEIIMLGLDYLLIGACVAFFFWQTTIH